MNIAPCAFCCSDNAWVLRYTSMGETDFVVKCRNCGAKITRKSEIEAISAWNEAYERSKVVIPMGVYDADEA